MHQKCQMREIAVNRFLTAAYNVNAAVKIYQRLFLSFDDVTFLHQTAGQRTRLNNESANELKSNPAQALQQCLSQSETSTKVNPKPDALKNG